MEQVEPVYKRGGGGGGVGTNSNGMDIRVQWFSQLDGIHQQKDTK